MRVLADRRQPRSCAGSRWAWPNRCRCPLFPYLRSGYLKKGRTLEELATNCGIDPADLRATVAAFNGNARRGVDPDFGRGETPFNRYGGDPERSAQPVAGARSRRARSTR